MPMEGDVATMFRSHPGKHPSRDACDGDDDDDDVDEDDDE